MTVQARVSTEFVRWFRAVPEGIPECERNPTAALRPTTLMGPDFAVAAVGARLDFRLFAAR